MLFTSFDFLLFLPPVLAGYWLLASRPRARILLVLCASYLFYSAGSKPVGGELPPAWYFAGLMVLSTVVDYLAGLAIFAAQARGKSGRGWLGVSLITNLGLLGYFKYAGFFVEVANSVAASTGLSWAAPALRVTLPIGISFYTFQSLSYTIDVARGKLEPERSFLRFALFVACFPQLIAGPIVRASELLPQLRRGATVTKEDVDFALFRITKGIAKKVVLGDFIAARFTDIVFAAPQSYSSLENLLALYAFTLQIYADFAGYSDIAIGVARLFGWRLPENFDRPYQAASIAEFWRRWHITLSTWLRDYLFFPLGGSRGSLSRTCVNLWLTMFLIGMWHGASYNFVIYANLQALAMVLQRIGSQRSPSASRRVTKGIGLSAVVMVAGAALAWLLGWGPVALVFAAVVAALVFGLTLLSERNDRWMVALRVAATFHFVVISRIFFRADSLDLASSMGARLFAMDGLGVRAGLFRLHDLYARIETSSLTGLLRESALVIADQGILLLILIGLGMHFIPSRLSDRIGLKFFSRAPAWGVAGTIALLGAALPRLLAGPRPNIYFAF